ncbi:Xenobiotic-transporting ATPase protein [Dioscorea alata]|uniref:Xenobiotic-transporting ATPase protein n=1 Tax=Dioscorea alata TaxID=55571 RepID=A0ACB7UAA0_DIOAL|nr:Xenobiotic-transporting ATPase protein [Dioscorea alata]
MRMNEVESHLLEPLVNGHDDGKSLERNHDSLYSSANFFSMLSFSWVGPLLCLGKRKRLDLDDIPKLASHDSACHVFSVFSHKLQLDCRIGSFKLVKALFLSVWREVLLSILFALCFTCASFIGPYLLDAFVRYLEARQEATVKGQQRHWFFQTQRFSMKSQAALVAMIYKKSLAISNQSKQSGDAEIVNLMSVDAERIGDFSWYMIDLSLIPFQVGLSLVILYKSLGLASLVTFAATVLVMVLNFPFSKLEQAFEEKIMECRDKRIKATFEILRNMRILKFYGWEMRFLSKILELRKNEMNWLKKYLYTEVIATFVYWGAPIFVSVATFSACLLMGIPLESGKVLSALATFNMLKDPICNLPDIISLLAQTLVSVDRISTFLSLEEWQPDIVEMFPRGSSDVAVEISDGNFSWEPSSSNCTLKDLNLQVSHGMKVAVCGTVGSGKSSLLCCMLGEILKKSGTIKLCGNVAYVAQSPWIQSGTVESNIIFGMEMSREKYERILEACSLKKDLEILPQGDQTIIGERGINLSGGQKQRLQIARALYRDADIYLFDDPFSAVDARTGNHIFKDCILEYLGSKTVIYVTHQVEFISNADLILVMKEGRIDQAGRYSDIASVEAGLMELVKAHMSSLSVVNTANGFQPDSNTANDLNSLHMEEYHSHSEIERENKFDEQNGSLTGQLIQEEERESGNVALSVYWRYITVLYKGTLVPFILLAYVLFQVLQISSNYWMATSAPVTKDTSNSVDGSTLILVYFLLALGSSLCVLLRVSLLATAGFKTAKLLFHKLHRCIFRAPMSFFDATPSGRILNRVSTDQSAIDESIPFNLGLFVSATTEFLGIVVVMSQVAWQVFVVFVPVTAICIWYQQFYIATARELTRLMGVRNAPVIQHFAETISGLTTIRSFNEESRFLLTSTQLIDAYLRPKFHNFAVMEWLCFRLDILSSSVFTFSLAFLILIPPAAINPGVAGLAVTYGLSLSSLLALVVWNTCNLENKIISVELIFQYTHIPSEPPLVVEANQPPQNWPYCGEVIIRDLQVIFNPVRSPFASCFAITCRFPGGTKTGIVGRTGSGKSTLIQALFRIIEPTSGEVLIDGIDISTIGLLDLRSRLSIIPQDPTMFEGTMRSNLDPLEEYNDEQIWEVLDKCQLGDEIRRKENKLDTPVKENGENWSVGQRQLVCLGRVLLRKNKILALDEATASVDTTTDVLIQRTLRMHFYEVTVITIAHRIASVLDSDNVLLLDNGRVVEYESPSTLLQDESSDFAKLVKANTSRH